MSAPITHVQWQPIWASPQTISLTTASCTNFGALATCGAVRLAAGGVPLWINFASSATVGGVGCLYLPANTAEYFETSGGIIISVKADTSANPMMANATPCV